MKRISSYYHFVDIVENYRPIVAAFRWCNARIEVDTAGTIFFVSYETDMLSYNRYTGRLHKLSNVETTTTLQHLRKFFDMVSCRKDYYCFRKIKKGDFLIIYE